MPRAAARTLLLASAALLRRRGPPPSFRIEHRAAHRSRRRRRGRHARRLCAPKQRDEESVHLVFIAIYADEAVGLRRGKAVARDPATMPARQRGRELPAASRSRAALLAAPRESRGDDFFVFRRKNGARGVPGESSKMLGGASQIVSMIRVKYNGK